MKERKECKLCGCNEDYKDLSYTAYRELLDIDVEIKKYGYLCGSCRQKFEWGED